MPKALLLFRSNRTDSFPSRIELCRIFFELIQIVYTNSSHSRFPMIYARLSPECVNCVERLQRHGYYVPVLESVLPRRGAPEAGAET